MNAPAAAPLSNLAVAVINYNTRDLLAGCLRSALALGMREVVVVDNVSTDGSLDMLHEQFPGVTVIANTRNHGYGAACNQGARAVRAAYVLLLNSDTLLPASTDGLCAQLERMQRDPCIALLGPRLRNADGSLQRSCFPFPTPLDIFLDATHLGQLARLLPALRTRYLRTWQHDRERAVPWVSGAALLVRRAALEQVGGFDERFFMYYEEVDLCYRLRQAGLQVLYSPLAEITHLGGASTRQKRAPMLVQFYASLALFYRQHYGPPRQAALALLVRGIALARLVRDGLGLLAAHGSRRHWLRESCRAWWALMGGRWRKEAVIG